MKDTKKVLKWAADLAKDVGKAVLEEAKVPENKGVTLKPAAVAKLFRDLAADLRKGPQEGEL